MRNSKNVIAAVVCLGALASALLFVRRPAEAPRPAPGPAPAGLRARWPAQQRLDYTLSWHARTSGEIAPGNANQDGTLLNLAATVEGEVSLERAGGTEQEQQVALSYTRFDKFSFDMQGQEAQAQLEQMSKQLAGQAAFLTIDERGRIGSIAFPPEMQPAARSVLRALALQLGYTLPAGDEVSWEADEEDTVGEAHVRYRRGAGELAREPLAFNKLDVVRGPLDGKQELRGGALIALDSSGLPISIDETTDAVYTRPARRSRRSTRAESFFAAPQGRGQESTARSPAGRRARAAAAAPRVESTIPSGSGAAISACRKAWPPRTCCRCSSASRRAPAPATSTWCAPRPICACIRTRCRWCWPSSQRPSCRCVGAG